MRLVEDLGRLSEGPANPVLVEATRSDSVESRHRGAAVVCDAGGRVEAAWGCWTSPVFLRSTAKPMQALPLVATGAARRFGVSAYELALAAGSHSGQDEHAFAAARWLARLGLGEGDLICGGHPPLCEATAALLARAGDAPSPLRNNCSGKHAGFLTLALHLGASPEGYGDPDHPAQRAALAAISEVTGEPIEAAAVGLDGCGAPAPAIPLGGLARAFARFADPARLPSARWASAAAAVAAAMTAHPSAVAGGDRFDTRAIAVSGGAVIAKGGAEGVWAAALTRPKLGIAVKIDDGAKRAAEAAIAALIIRFGRLDPSERAAIAAFANRPILNTQNRLAGALRCAPGWLGATG